IFYKIRCTLCQNFSFCCIKQCFLNRLSNTSFELKTCSSSLKSIIYMYIFQLLVKFSFFCFVIILLSFKLRLKLSNLSFSIFKLLSKLLISCIFLELCLQLGYFSISCIELCLYCFYRISFCFIFTEYALSVIIALFTISFFYSSNIENIGIILSMQSTNF